MKYRIQKNNRKGFSLPEIIIIVAIVGIMTSVTLVYLGGERQEERLESASRIVASSIRELQNNALTGKQIGSIIACGYGFEDISIADPDYELFYNQQINDTCEGVSNYHDGLNSPAYKTIDLPENLYFSTNTSAVYFETPHAAVYEGVDTPLSASRAIGISDGSSTYYVCIKPSGQVVENGTNGTCPSS